METKELRLGNYVKTWTHIVEVESVTHNLVQSRKLTSIDPYLVGKEHFYFIKPIPITEQWLLDLGFKAKKVYNRTFYYADSFDEWKVIYQDGLIKRNGKVIKHIHQLQNLYFALTGQELKLKNNE